MRATLAAWVAVALGGPLAPVARADVQPREGPGRPLLVFAAASVSEVMDALARRSPDGAVITSFGPSSQLARQIRDGAPADVFVSASRAWIRDLADDDLLTGAPAVVATNSLVAVATSASDLARAGARDPAQLLKRLPDTARVGVADEGVPAGEYARTALARLGLLDAYASRMVGLKDVRAVLHAVERGELVAGFVYATDARVADVRPLFVLDPGLHPRIEVVAAVPRTARSPDGARRFVEFLGSELARALFARAGFGAPSTCEEPC